MSALRAQLDAQYSKLWDQQASFQAEIRAALKAWFASPAAKAAAAA